MLQFLKQVLSDSLGEFSSKRLIAFMAFFLIAVAFLSNLFGGYVVLQFMYESMMYIVLGGMGLATVEPLANSKLLNKDTTKIETKVETSTKTD